MSDFDKEDKRKVAKKSEHEEHFEFEESLMSDNELQRVHAQLFREKAEPSEKMEPVPLFILFLIGALLFFGGFYLAKYSGGFRGDVFDPNWTGGAKIEAKKVDLDPMVVGKKLFTRTCQQCHQADGKGLPGVYPPLAGSEWLLGSDTRPIKILIKGMSGPITVEGHDFNGNMPPVGDWRDFSIAAVLTYVRQQWGNDAGPISEELVAQVREQIKDRTKPWTGPEILAEDPL